MNKQKRRINEHKFQNWEVLQDGRRRYWYDVPGRLGWIARYVKEVNVNEETLRFYQEIYNDKKELIEVHEKYPKDLGHKKIDKE